MKRTRKWNFVQQEAERLAGLGLSPLEISRRLEVAKSTVTRWMRAGKLVRRPRIKVPSAVGVLQLPEEWAKMVRETYSLDATDNQLVSLAETALALAKNTAEVPAVRLQAMGRFQAMVKQLALVARLADQEAAGPVKPERAARVRPAVDPRNVLRAV